MRSRPPATRKTVPPAGGRAKRPASATRRNVAKPAHQSPQVPRIALLIETSNAYARGLLAGIEDYIRSHGPWNVYLAEHGRGDRPPAWMLDWSGDGIIARIENKRTADALSRMRVPIVDVSAARLMPQVPTVTTDNAAIARMALQHFIERGFERFAFCGDARFAWSVSRGEHFARLVGDSGYACQEYVPTGRAADGYGETEMIARWLRRLPQPVAVFACYDYRGQQVLDACRRAGLLVPEQVAVLGVDNDELLCQLSPPPLSSIILNSQRGGWEAAEILGRMMRGEKVPPVAPHFVLPLGVATRQSTDSLAVDDPQLARALRYIRDHANEGISVGDVLRHCPMARRNFETRMKATIGRTPREEITRVQIHRVKELLAGSSLSLSEISHRTGFKHVEYLTVVFKRETGMTPSAYRYEQQPGLRGRMPGPR